MPITPSTYLPIASIAPETLTLCITTLVQCTGILSGLLLALLFATTWKG